MWRAATRWCSRVGTGRAAAVAVRSGGGDRGRAGPQRHARTRRALSDVGHVDRLVVAAIERDRTRRRLRRHRATKLAVLKLVGYTEVLHTLLPRMSAESSIVFFGGRAKDRPYPGR